MHEFLHLGLHETQPFILSISRMILYIMFASSEKKTREKKRKEGPKRYLLSPETAQKKFFFFKEKLHENVEQLRPNKSDFEHPIKDKEQKKKKKKEKREKKKKKKQRGKKKRKIAEKRRCRNDKNGPLVNAHFSLENAGEPPSNVWFSWGEVPFLDVIRAVSHCFLSPLTLGLACLLLFLHQDLPLLFFKSFSLLVSPLFRLLCCFLLFLSCLFLLCPCRLSGCLPVFLYPSFYRLHRSLLHLHQCLEEVFASNSKNILLSDELVSLLSWWA